jgi:transposase
MGDYSEVFVAFDVAKLKNAVAIAEAGRVGEVRYLDEIENTAEAVRRLIVKLSARYAQLTLLLRGRSYRLWASPLDQGSWA